MAGGEGTRLKPYTYVANKHTALVYDKPLIWFPIQTLVGAGIDDIVISTNSPEQIKAVLKDETFNAQVRIEGRGNVGQVSALQVMQPLIQDQNLCVMYGDVYLSSPLPKFENSNNCTILASGDFNKERTSEYGIIEIGPDGGVLSIEEKPAIPKGRHINAGVMAFPRDLMDIISQMPGGDERILTDVAIQYYQRGRLVAVEYTGKVHNGGTPEDLFQASVHRRRQIMRQV